MLYISAEDFLEKTKTAARITREEERALAAAAKAGDAGARERLMEAYGAVLSCDRDLLYKMKELWFYLLDSFLDSEKVRKQIRKCEKLSEYKTVVEKLFFESNLI